MPSRNPGSPWHKCLKWHRRGTYEECIRCFGMKRGWEIEGEEWRPIPGFAEYLASSLGRVKHVSPARAPIKTYADTRLNQRRSRETLQGRP